jgi:hypothetical protein
VIRVGEGLEEPNCDGRVMAHAVSHFSILVYYFLFICTLFKLCTCSVQFKCVFSQVCVKERETCILHISQKVLHCSLAQGPKFCFEVFHLPCYMLVLSCSVKVCHYVYKSSPLDPLLSQLKQLHTYTSCFFKIRFGIFLSVHRSLNSD